MAEIDLSLIMKLLEQLQEEQRATRQEVREMREEMNNHHMRMARDISGLTRISRHNAADLDDLERRIEALEAEER